MQSWVWLSNSCNGWKHLTWILWAECIELMVRAEKIMSTRDAKVTDQQLMEDFPQWRGENKFRVVCKDCLHKERKAFKWDTTPGSDHRKLLGLLFLKQFFSGFITLACSQPKMGFTRDPTCLFWTYGWQIHQNTYQCTAMEQQPHNHWPIGNNFLTPSCFLLTVQSYIQFFHSKIYLAS